MKLKTKTFLSKLHIYYPRIMTAAFIFICSTPVYAVDDMWTVGKNIIVDVYGKIAGISTLVCWACNPYALMKKV